MALFLVIFIVTTLRTSIPIDMTVFVRRKAYSGYVKTGHEWKVWISAYYYKHVWHPEMLLK
jgi:hypothetical protein